MSDEYLNPEKAAEAIDTARALRKLPRWKLDGAIIVGRTVIRDIRDLADAVEVGLCTIPMDRWASSDFDEDDERRGPDAGHHG